MTWFDKQTSSRVGVTQNFVTASTSVPSNTFGPQTYQVRVAVSGQIVYVKIGDGTPVAATTGDGGVLMPAATIDYFACTPGQKAAFIGGPVGAVVTLTEMQ